MIFLEYAIDVADACRDARHRRRSRSPRATSAPEPRREFFAHIDAANVDLKAFTEDFYRHVCGGHLGAVLDTLEYLVHETDVWVEITNLLIPGQNDSDAELDAMTRWVVEHLGPDVPMHFTAFHPDFKMLDVPPTPPATLDAGRARSRSRNGVRYAYTGNVHDPAGGSTVLRRLRRRRHRARLVRHRRLPRSPTTALRAAAARRCPAGSTARPAPGAPGACRCGSLASGPVGDEPR